MINLIPNEEKKKIRKDFYMRVVIVSFFVLGLSILVSNIMLIPALFYASLEKKLAQNHFDQNQNKLSLDLGENNKAIIENLENKINIVKKAKENNFLVSEKVINVLLNKKTEGIKINQISFTSDEAKGKIININGQALSREKLLFFKKNLEKDGNFKNIDLPISNFIKSTDIEFSLILIPA